MFQMRRFSMLLRNLYFKLGLHTAAPNTYLFEAHYAIRKAYFKLQAIKKLIFPKTKTASTTKYEVLTEFSANEEIRRIVILKLDHMGDFVVAIDAFKMLREAFQSAEITLVCLPFVSVLAKATNIFDKVISYEAFVESKKFSINKFVPLKKLSDCLDGHYCLAVDMRHDADTRHYLTQISADYRAGFFGACESKLDVSIPPLEWDVSVGDDRNIYYPIHSSTRLKLLALAIVDFFKEKNYIDSFRLSEKALDSKIPKGIKLKVGVCLGAGAETREWPFEYWVDFLRKIIEQNSAFIIFFGDSHDAVLSEKIFKLLNLNEESGLNLAGKIELPDLPSFMSDLDLYIGGDTGPTHLAAASGIKTIDIYPGISNISVWKAKGEKVCVLHAKVPCAPCHLRSLKDCVHGHMCMKLIEPNHVYNAFQNFLLDQTKVSCEPTNLIT